MHCSEDINSYFCTKNDRALSIVDTRPNNLIDITLLLEDMASWNDLPFEIKRQILAHYIYISMRGAPSSYGPFDPVIHYGNLTRTVMSFLCNAPEMLDEAVSLVKSQIKRHRYFDTEFENAWDFQKYFKENFEEYARAYWYISWVRASGERDVNWRQFDDREEAELLDSFVRRCNMLD